MFTELVSPRERKNLRRLALDAAPDPHNLRQDDIWNYLCPELVVRLIDQIEAIERENRRLERVATDNFAQMTEVLGRAGQLDNLVEAARAFRQATDGSADAAKQQLLAALDALDVEAAAERRAA